MLSVVWFTFFYQPVFNFLIWIYTFIAGQNLGWAVIWLTIFLRVALLPLTYLAQRNAAQREAIEEQAVQTAEAFKGDVVAQKEAIRLALKKNKVSPWAKVLVLAVQLLVLVLLYQVFIKGIGGEKVLKTLYSFIQYPGPLNINFYGFDIGKRHDVIWSGAAALYLFVSILLENQRKSWDARGASFLFLFPLATFFALWLLPMVKSLFILTSMIFSDIISVLVDLMAPKAKKKT